MLIWDEGLLSTDDFLRSVYNRRGQYPILVNNKGQEYYNIPAAFDIEVSSFYEHEEKRAIMYCWQFGIDNLVTLGRTWDEFLFLLDTLKKIMVLGDNRFLVIYVHNLPYEFQFLRKHIKWMEVFLLDRLKPVYARTSGFEFRCSLKLSGGKSLANVAKDLTKYDISKKAGDLDYKLVRTPKTPLTKKELRYCEYDIRILQCYIHEKIEQDGDILKIPLTNTGYVRNFCRTKCFRHWRRYRNFISNLTLDPDEFSQLQRAFQGGFTHANAHYARKILTNISSADISSSYPTVMLLEQFPMSRPTLVTKELSEGELRNLLFNKCCLFDIDIYNLLPALYHEHPISSSKCEGVKSQSKSDNILIDNGRIVMAEHVKTTITEQDYFTLSRFYKWDKIIISNFRYYEKSYLPKALVMAILELYGKKTELKDVEGEEVNYMISKNMINSAYGMMVTNPVRDILEYKDGEYIDPIKPDINEALEKYNNNKRRFLSYAWGVWVTAYARANLFSGIASLGKDYVYSDTDSLKYMNREDHKDYFDTYNAEIREKIKLSAAYHRIDEKLFSPETNNGKVKTIGVWDDEGTYSQFKTIGAKRYLYSKKFKTEFEDGEITVQLTGIEIRATIAGANKAKASGYLQTTGDPFGEFDHNLIIPEEWSGRLILTYINHETEGDVVDYLGNTYHYQELSSIHMENSEYSLSMHEYIEYLKGYIDISE